VFVTGNAGKLREVREILAQGTPIEVDSRDLDRECELYPGSFESITQIGGANFNCF